MSEEMKKLTEILPIESIDFRIQSINNGKYATILAYKNARVDMQRLDDAVGPLNWKREHVNSNANCIVSIWCSEKNEWVSKEDTGTESNTEAKKGLASDSFKRACFNWGIGRELYEYPKISVLLKNDEVQETGNARPKYKASFNLKLKEWTWTSAFVKGKLAWLKGEDNNGNTRFSWQEGIPKAPKKKTPIKSTPVTPTKLPSKDVVIHAGGHKGKKVSDLTLEGLEALEENLGKFTHMPEAVQIDHDLLNAVREHILTLKPIEG